MLKFQNLCPSSHTNTNSSELQPDLFNFPQISCQLKICSLAITFLFNFFIYIWLLWVFFAALELSLVAASGSYSLVQGLECRLSSW